VVTTAACPEYWGAGVWVWIGRNSPSKSTVEETVPSLTIRRVVVIALTELPVILYA
jgi:hypothetical protein